LVTFYQDESLPFLRRSFKVLCGAGGSWEGREMKIQKYLEREESLHHGIKNWRVLSQGETWRGGVSVQRKIRLQFYTGLTQRSVYICIQKYKYENEAEYVFKKKKLGCS
jgi:hypothetical protein